MLPGLSQLTYNFLFNNELKFKKITAQQKIIYNKSPYPILKIVFYSVLAHAMSKLIISRYYIYWHI